MNVNTKICLIGPGVMAEAFIKGLISHEVVQSDSIFVAGPRRERVDELIKTYQIQGDTDNAKVASQADIIILAVKPQRLEAVMKSLQGKILPQALVISIVAGTTLEKIRTGLNHPYLVRAMPNTPAQIGEGVTVWTITGEHPEAHMEEARKIFSAFGKEIFVEDEGYLDMSTALSGTGPAYVFLFMESMIDAGVHMGLPRRIAEQLVVQTISGSVDYYVDKATHPARLRNEVTSPGGTSAEAVYYLEKAGFRTALARAIWAAYERAQELGRGQSSRPTIKD